ncbi:MAG: ROK family protein [Verrucomicrobia bacterium]|nr:ROK family protein [Verrucomicrobiota bacterium]
MTRTLLAIEIGGTKLQIVVGDETGVIRERHRFTVDPTGGGAGIRQQLQPALQALIPATKPLAIGVGFGGPVDWRIGRICCSHQVEGWDDFELGQWLHSLTGLPAVVENDSNAATLGEALRGAGQGSDPVFYFNMGSGVGGGLVVNGKLFHGLKPGEAEFGHLRLDREGCTVESRCSGWAVDRRIRTAVKTAPSSVLARLAAGQSSGEAKHLAEALRQGDALARQIIDETANDLAFALSHVVHLLHPQVIVMGGGLSLLGEPLRTAVEGQLRAHVMEAFAPGPPIRLSGLGEDAVPVGALLLAQQALT